MLTLHWDIETRSALDLRKTSAWKYAGHPTTDIWFARYALDDDPVLIWKPGDPIPEVFAKGYYRVVVAHNAMFETAIAERILTPRYGWPVIPIERVRCTMAAALADARPPALDDAAAAYNLSLRKDEEGAALMMQMARPRKPRPGEAPGLYWHDDPEKIERLCRYCARDVEVERELHHRVPPLSDDEQAIWVFNYHCNRRGFRVDVPLAEAAEKIVKAQLNAINSEVCALTGGAIERISQVPRIKKFVNGRGHKMTGTTKRHVAAILAHHPEPEVDRLLRLRQEGGRASVAKLGALLAGENGGRLYDTLMYHRAATGRWAGSGFQPQNLSRSVPADEDAAIAAVLSGDLARVASVGPPIDLIASLSRSLIIAAPGCDLMPGDFSSIESRITAWYANETWKLAVYREFDRTGNPALEPYCMIASKVLGRTVTPDDEEGRQLGKLLDLAFGFGGGAGAFKRIAPDSGFSDAQIEHFKRQYRATHPETGMFWRRYFRMLRRVVRSGEPGKLDRVRAVMDGLVHRQAQSRRSGRSRSGRPRSRPPGRRPSGDDRPGCAHHYVPRSAGEQRRFRLARARPLRG
jgi:DNA polymerase